MIIDIKKGAFVKGLIQYHEKKIQEGKGVLLMDNTLSNDKDDRIKAFLETAELNPRIYRNKFVHFSVSFAKEDSVMVDPDLMVKVAKEYLKEMGYVDTPVLVYEHGDKKHKHFHIITTSMDYSGKKIPEMLDHFKSQTLARKIEKDFGFQETLYATKKELQLSELSAVKYRIFNVLASNEKSKILENDLSGLMPIDLKDKLILNKMSDYEIQKDFEKRAIPLENIHKIYRILKQHDLFYQTNKEILHDKLNHLKSISKTREQFMDQVEKDGIYIRKIAKSNGSYSLTYGITDKNFYVKEKDLPVAFRYDYLFTGRKLDFAFDAGQQQSYLRRIVLRNLKRSNSKLEFEKRLNEAGVQIKYASNTAGIYGVSFSSSNMKEPVTFKASQLARELSWPNIAQQLNIQPQPTLSKQDSPEPLSKNEISPSLKGIIDPLSRAKGIHDDEEEKRRRKREQNPDKDRELDL